MPLIGLPLVGKILGGVVGLLTGTSQDKKEDVKQAGKGVVALGALTVIIGQVVELTAAVEQLTIAFGALVAVFGGIISGVAKVRQNKEKQNGTSD